MTQKYRKKILKLPMIVHEYKYFKHKTGRNNIKKKNNIETTHKVRRRFCSSCYCTLKTTLKDKL